MTHSINMPYDSEILRMEEVVRELNALRETRMNPQDFVDLARDKFAAIGFDVSVNTFYTGEVKGYHPITQEPMVEEVKGLWSFDITVNGRTDKHEFDHEQMAREVQSNILELPGAKPGQIRAEKNLDEIVREMTKGHRH